MKSVFTLLIILFSMIASISQETIYGDLTYDNVDREYILYVPSSYDPTSAVPLLFNFHGYSSNAWEQMNYGDFRQLADQHNFIVVHPEGTLDNSGTTHFNVGWGGSTTDDVGFTEALIEEISNMYNIDSERVYSTGMSNGGFMSYTLACNLSDKIAAIASVTGSMSPLNFNNCSSSHPMPILEIHGTADNVVPYGGGSFAISIDNVLDYWINFNGNNATPEIISIDDSNTSDQSTVEHFIYGDGNNDVNVELFKVISGGHTWPGSAFSSVGTNYDINASEEVWKFLSRYNIHGKTSSTTEKENKQRSQVYPNPTRGIIRVFNSKSDKYLLKDQYGSTVRQGVLSNNLLDISDLASGIYILSALDQAYKIVKL